MNPNGGGKHAIATQTRLLDPDWGTAPLIKVNSSMPDQGAAKVSAPLRPITMPTWVATRYGQGQPSTSRWSR